MDSYTVYMHTCPNGKKYVGITKQTLEMRFKSGSKYKGCIAFDRAIKKHGWNNIDHEILFTGLSYDEACQKEIEMIKYYDSTNPMFGYNIDLGGNSPGKISDSTKEKLRIINKGNKFFLGKTHNERTKQILREKSVGNRNAAGHTMTHTDEYKEKMKTLGKSRGFSDRAKEASKKSKLGVPRTQKTKDKISKSLKGKFTGENRYNHKPVIQFDTNMEIIKKWECISKACEVHGYATTNISKCCNGKRKTAYGYIWKYAEVSTC